MMLLYGMASPAPNHPPTDQPETPLSRLHAALDLMELGIELMRGNIKRRMPHFSSEQVAAELQSWIEKPLDSEFYETRPKS